MQHGRAPGDGGCRRRSKDSRQGRILHSRGKKENGRKRVSGKTGLLRRNLSCRAFKETVPTLIAHATIRHPPRRSELGDQSESWMNLKTTGCQFCRSRCAPKDTSFLFLSSYIYLFIYFFFATTFSPYLEIHPVWLSNPQILPCKFRIIISPGFLKFHLHILGINCKPDKEGGLNKYAEGFKKK